MTAAFDSSLYSWQRSAWLALTGFSKLAHAVMLTGQSGLGKELFAARLAQSLLCRSPNRCHAVRAVSGLPVIRRRQPPRFTPHPPAPDRQGDSDRPVRALGEFYLRPRRRRT